MNKSELDCHIKAEYFERKAAFAATVPDYESTVNSDAARAIEVWKNQLARSR